MPDDAAEQQRRMMADGFERIAKLISDRDQVNAAAFSEFASSLKKLESDANQQRSDHREVRDQLTRVLKQIEPPNGKSLETWRSDMEGNIGRTASELEKVKMEIEQHKGNFVKWMAGVFGAMVAGALGYVLHQTGISGGK